MLCRVFFDLAIEPFCHSTLPLQDPSAVEPARAGGPQDRVVGLQPQGLSEGGGRERRYQHQEHRWRLPRHLHRHRSWTGDARLRVLLVRCRLSLLVLGDVVSVSKVLEGHFLLMQFDKLPVRLLSSQCLDISIVYASR